MLFHVVLLVCLGSANSRPADGAEPLDNASEPLEVVVVDVVPVDGVLRVELEEVQAALEEKISTLDMLIKFFHPGWSWTPSRDCGMDCPYLADLTKYGAVQWQVESTFMDGVYDLEFVNEKGRWYGNMDFYDTHMWLRGCGWVEYLTEAPKSTSGTVRTWSFAKRPDGFSLWCERELLVDYTYTEGRCANLWGGSTFGFFFETQPTGVHLLQKGMDMFWWDN